MIDGSEKRKRQLALELIQRSLVFEKCSNKLKICMIMYFQPCSPEDLLLIMRSQ